MSTVCYFPALMAYIHNYMLLEIKRNLFINTTELYVIVVTSNVTLWFPLWILCKFFVLLWYFLTIITVFCKNGRVFCFFFLVLFNRFHRYWCFSLLACACHNNYNGKIRPTHFFFLSKWFNIWLLWSLHTIMYMHSIFWWTKRKTRKISRTVSIKIRITLYQLLNL